MMNDAVALTGTTSMDEAQGAIALLHGQSPQALWRITQLNTELFDSSPDWQTRERLSDQRPWLSLFPSVEPPAA